MNDAYSVAAHWQGPFDEGRLQRWAEALRKQLHGGKPALGLVFMTPAFYADAAQILDVIRIHAQVPLLLGCSTTGVIAGTHEWEEEAGLALGLYVLPGADLRLYRFTQKQVEEASRPEDWHAATGVSADSTNGWLVFLDPFQLDAESWLRQWNQAYPHRPIIGGLASGSPEEGGQATQLYCNGEVLNEGGVVLSIGGDVALMGMISQGCTPIGDTWTITKADQNLIYEIANRPAFDVLAETYRKLSPIEQEKVKGNLFVGLVINEYLEEFHRGDFLVRNLLGADPQSGVIAVGAFPHAGQSIQFQRRDAAASTEDMTTLLERLQRELAGQNILGGCLCSCNGRGFQLFGERDHDARHIQQQLGPFGLVGFFCNGEVGPVGDRNFIHGYTASLALFIRRSLNPRPGPD